MSALGSTVINKSSKKFAPKKAPLRHAGRREAIQTSQTPSGHITDQIPAQDRLESAPDPLENVRSPQQELTSSSSILPGKRKLDGTALTNPENHSQTSSTIQAKAAVEARSNGEKSDLVKSSPKRIRHEDAPSPHKDKLSSTSEIQEGHDPSHNPIRQTRSKLAEANSVHADDQAEVGPTRAVRKTGTQNLQNVAHSALANGVMSSESHEIAHAPAMNFAQTAVSSDHISTISNSNTAANADRSTNVRKSRKPQRKTLEQTAAAIVDDAVSVSEKPTRRGGRKSRLREATPEDGESRTILTSKVTMNELCKDSGIGKKSTRQRDLKLRDQQDYVQKKQRELQALVGDVAAEDSSSRPQTTSGNQAQDSKALSQHLSEMNVPRTVIVNGQIQIDEESLRIDRHAAAETERLNGPEQLPPIEEDDLSRKVTSGTFLKRDKGGKWNASLLDRFYQGLGMFGTDFEMISQMFPGKSRHAIKLKFCKEEKLDHARIKAALLGDQIPVVLADYEALTGSAYSHPEELDRLLEEDRRLLEDERAIEREAVETAMKDREAQAVAEAAVISERHKDVPDKPNLEKHGKIGTSSVSHRPSRTSHNRQ